LQGVVDLTKTLLFPKTMDKPQRQKASDMLLEDNGEIESAAVASHRMINNAKEQHKIKATLTFIASRTEPSRAA
jgi:hypothetical protein